MAPSERRLRAGGRGRGRERAHQAPEVVQLPSVAGKLPPHDLDAEAAVLSACFLSKTALDVALTIVKPEHFYSPANQKIFQAMRALVVAETPVDNVNVASWLRDRGWLEGVGGTAYLVGLADASPAIGNIGAHARTVLGKWTRREVIARAQRVFVEGYDDVDDDFGYAKSTVEIFDELAQGGEEKHHLAPVAKVVKVAFEQITQAAERGDRIVGTPTGFERLDAKTAGLSDGDLVIVAGRPGMGKSAWVMNVATNVASPPSKPVPPEAITARLAKGWPRDAAESVPYHQGRGVCVFSLEMPREQLATRMVCSEGRVDLGKVRQGHLHADDWRKLTEAAQYVSSLPVWIDDTPGITLLEMRAKVQRIKAEYEAAATDTQGEKKVGLVVVDYLQLCTGPGESREQVIAEISRGLKGLAKQLKVPVIALSQLNRAVETRGKDKHPQLSDLRESGAIEQDADMILFLTRDEYYDPDTDLKGICDIDIAKQRNGPTGRIRVRFSASCTRFDNLEPGDYPEDKEDS